MMELGSVTEGRPGPARHSRTPGFPPTGPAVGGCRARSVTEGRPALWSPARVERAWPFSGSQHGRCGHGRSLVPSTGGTWPGGGALRCCRRKKRRRRTKERREEEERREILIGADQDQDLFFFYCDSLVFSNKKFCLWFSLAGVVEETKS